MEQRAKAAGKHKAALVYRRFIEQQKRKTKNRTGLMAVFQNNLLAGAGAQSSDNTHNKPIN